MSSIKSLLLQSLLLFFLELATYKFAFGVPIASEAKTESNAPLLTGSDNCSKTPCACCSDQLLVLADQYSKANGDGNSDCASFLKNLFCTLACNEESSEVGSISNEIMILTVCDSGCSEILTKCPGKGTKKTEGNKGENKQAESGEKKEEKSKSPKNEEKKGASEKPTQENGGDSATTSNNKVAISNKISGLKNAEKITIGSFGVSDSLNLKEDKSKCSAIKAPSMYTTKSSKYSLAFIQASSDTKVCLNSSGGFEFVTRSVPILKSESGSSGKTASSQYVQAATTATNTAKPTVNAPLTEEEIKCGFCFSRCCCWPVWSGSIISFAAYLIMAFLAIYWQSALFSLGLKSTHFWKGGGYWLAGSGGLGVFVGMLVGGLVSSCFAGALSLGGSLTNLFMSVLLVGRLGAALGGIGGLGTGASIGLMAHSGTISWVVGLILGLLLGLVVGFSPIARSLKMNDRYIRRGIRQRELRRRSRLSDGGYHSEGFSDASGTDRGKRNSVHRHTSSESKDNGNHTNEGRSHSSSSAANNVN
ncbi:signal peptide-containing protein [Cryptosporidium canis]|uniref:Signal peptide-containing protein n=1 Tax=Cryptosporidium canis TaxID=195482 RepID=A0A9D5HZ64_9CRYT|nr:signal peptide-containing protein [Cryptosporidium canis]